MITDERKMSLLHGAPARTTEEGRWLRDERARLSLQHWSITVRANGEDVVTIESNSLSGRKIGPMEELAIRTAARRLLSFIGDVSA